MASCFRPPPSSYGRPRSTLEMQRKAEQAEQEALAAAHDAAAAGDGGGEDGGGGSTDLDAEVSTEGGYFQALTAEHEALEASGAPPEELDAYESAMETLAESFVTLRDARQPSANVKKDRLPEAWQSLCWWQEWRPLRR